jgi:hypothetical protein
MCVYSLVVLSCLFFATILMKPTVVICPDTPLANESLVQSANERSVWRDGGIWITPAAGRVNAGEFLCHIWLPQAKCCWLEKYPSSLHWIGESIFELWNCAWLLSPGPSGKRHFPEQYMTCYWYSACPRRGSCIRLNIVLWRACLSGENLRRQEKENPWGRIWRKCANTPRVI